MRMGGGELAEGVLRPDKEWPTSEGQRKED